MSGLRRKLEASPGAGERQPGPRVCEKPPEEKVALSFEVPSRLPTRPNSQLADVQAEPESGCVPKLFKLIQSHSFSLVEAVRRELPVAHARRYLSDAAYLGLKLCWALGRSNRDLAGTGRKRERSNFFPFIMRLCSPSRMGDFNSFQFNFYFGISYFVTRKSWFWGFILPDFGRNDICFLR